MKKEFIAFFDADIAKLRKEVEAFADDDTFWNAPESVPNSPGNLTLHLLGNLNHYIGAKLGNTGYVRKRPLEFSSGAQPRSDLLDHIEETRRVVTSVIGHLSDKDFRSDYLADDGDEVRTIAAELVRILSHLNYHLGQINYYRRLSSKTRS
jgi:Protein of unknown function (DUF1572)